MRDIEKDAARYRWLKNTNGMEFRDSMGEAGAIDTIMRCDVGGEWGLATSLDPCEMDAAIDEAMERWPQDD